MAQIERIFFDQTHVYPATAVWYTTPAQYADGGVGDATTYQQAGMRDHSTTRVARPRPVLHHVAARSCICSLGSGNILLSYGGLER
jgi:hypothetical protein